MKKKKRRFIGPSKAAPPLRPPSGKLINRALERACREDFASFVKKCYDYLHPGRPLLWNWHLDLMAFRVEQARVGKINRLMINSLPRSLKSFIVSVALPAFILGHDPTKRVIVISYGLDLAIKLSNDCRAVLNARWYRRLFPDTQISRSKNTEIEVVTTKGGYRLAASIDGALTGRGGDIIIIDDPLKPSDALSDSKREHVNELFFSTVLSRLDDQQNGAIIVVMQRLHVDDLCGRLLRTSNEWTHLKLAAIAEEDEQFQIAEHDYHTRCAGDLLHPERTPMSVLEAKKSEIGAYHFAAQYQQRPVPLEGTMINPAWIGRYDHPPIRTESSHIIQSWDPASKTGGENHWSVCVTLLIHENKYYLLDVLRGRFDYPTLKARAISHAQAYKAHRILVEDAGVGTALVAELQKAGLPAIAVKPEQDKRTRMSIQSSKFESGQVFFPKQAPWLAEFENELFAFPNAPHDDQVDALSQALAHGRPNSGWDNKSLENYSRLLSGLSWPY